MVQVNFALREVSCKVVYYGPGLSGKTTNLEIVHQKAPKGHKGKMTSLTTEGDRTLFFDYLPLDLGAIGGMKTKFQLYTVPGQVYYNATRKLVLRGADGIIFVADSHPAKMDENVESLDNLEQNLSENNIDINTIPIVFQWNKRDLSNAVPVSDLEKNVNRYGAPSFESVAIRGEGVFPTLKALAGMVLESVNKKGVTVEKEVAAPKPGERPAPAPSAPAPTQPVESPVQSPRISAPPKPATPQPVKPPAQPPVPPPAPIKGLRPSASSRSAPSPLAHQPPSPAGLPLARGGVGKPWETMRTKSADKTANIIFGATVVAIIALIIYYMFFR